jgi:hypothetical protein
MNIFKKYFNSLLKNELQNDVVTNHETITAKEKQSIFIKTYLKPTLKAHGYLTNVQTWWRDQGDFFIIVNLQNFSWNTRNEVDFCFNIGIALKSQMKDLSKNPAYNNLTVQTREDPYLSDLRNRNPSRGKNGYTISEHTDVNNFISEVKMDFESEILPKLDKLITINDCVEFYSKFPFWGDVLKKAINSKSE